MSELRYRETWSGRAAGAKLQWLSHSRSFLRSMSCRFIEDARVIDSEDRWGWIVRRLARS